MKNKLPQTTTDTSAQSNSQASAIGNIHNEAKQTSEVKPESKVVIHHKSNSGYDQTALILLNNFLKRWPKRRNKALVSYLLKTNQTFQEFSAFVLINERSITFRATAEEVYNDVLNWDIERPSYVRIWRSNKLTHYVCAPECGIYGDYDGDLWEDNGRLKQDVKDKAIRELKTELMVGTETTNV